ncbi:PP2C family protein-serine/threonine phosphatase [Flavobacterium sp. DSR3-2]|uniref:PP2C family protein-serine/threonine phosphatase n=1 Tax=Flavobacterium sp. DSR3-2 TaxID=2804634 RepID=UPI003CF3C398
MINIEHFKFSSKGKQEINEDYIGTLSAENLGLYFICDGTSNYGHGELAARMIAAEIINYTNKNHKEIQPVNLIQSAINAANESVWNKRKELKSKFGATLAGLYINDKVIHAFWIGDVRVYQIRNSQIIFQSTDHSLTNKLKQEFPTTSQKISNYSNIITASLSGKSIEKLSITELQPLQGDIFAICSDGLWKNIPMNIETLAGLNNQALKNTLTTYNEHFPDNYSIIKLLCTKI